MATRPSFSATGPALSRLSYGANPMAASDAYGADFNRQMTNSMNANAAQTRAAMAGATSDADWQKAQRQKITDLTEGRAGELANDPRMNQAMDFFGNVLNGSKLPFSEEVQRAQLNQQANGTASANAAQLRALEEAITASGGSLNDPSFQAKKQELMANRQGQNLDALGKMLSQAGIANFNAQAQGANSLAGIRGGQNNQINQMNLAGANYRAQDFRDTQTGNFGGGGSTFTTSILGGGGSQAPAFNPTGAFSPSVPSNVSTGLAGRPAQVNTAPYIVQTPGAQSASGGHTLQTGNTWGGQPYGGAPSAPTPPRPPTGTGMMSMPGLSISAQPYGPPAPQQSTFGTPFMRPLGPGQF